MIINNFDNDDKEFKKPHKVQYRGGFSDRNGINKISTKIQLKSFDERTRTAICNLFYKIIYGGIYKDNSHYYSFFDNTACEDFFIELISDFYCETVADFNFAAYERTEYYKEYIECLILNGNYGDVLSLCEFLVEFSSSYSATIHLKNIGFLTNMGQAVSVLINDIFEKEYVGYRLIDGKAVPISDEVEQKEIETILKVPFDGCRAHIRKALGFLSDREKPDYKNSIKESISAVESICQIITENNKATLGQALKLLEDKGIKLHSALKNSFSSLYGYTSDEGGIRHAEGLFESNVTFEEAKYMLVSCCAFVNYLIAEYGKIK